MKRVLLAGASGHLGQEIAKELKAKGYFIRALTRNENNFNKIQDNIDETFVGDVTKKETLKNICKDIDMVISCLGASVTTRLKDLSHTFHNTDFKGNLNLLREAVGNKIEKFIYVSVFQPDNDKSLKNLAYVDAHVKFENELKKSGLNYSIIRPNAFFSAMREIFDLIKTLGIFFVIGKGDKKTNPIHNNDLAKFCVDSITKDNFESSVGGSKVYTRKEVAQISFKALGKKSRIFNTPAFLANFSSFLMNPIKYRLIAMSTFIIKVMQIDMVAPTYGAQLLEDYFDELANNELNAPVHNKA